LTILKKLFYPVTKENIFKFSDIFLLSTMQFQLMEAGTLMKVMAILHPLENGKEIVD
jgi:hypothetical protein